MPSMAKLHATVRLSAEVVWLVLAAGASAMLLTSRNPRVPVLMAALLALAVPEHGDPGWRGFVSAVSARLGETLLYAAIAWSFEATSMRGAVGASALLSAALISPYVRARAKSLGVAGAPGASAERGVRLAIVTAGLFLGRGSFIGALWIAAGATAALAFARSAVIWRGARGA